MCILLALTTLIISCGKEDTVRLTNVNDLQGKWFRSYDNTFAGNIYQPSFERGKVHVTINFKKDGKFLHNTTFLGIYEGTTITDTSAIIIESGIYTTEGNTITINLEKSKWWDSFYENMEDFKVENINPNKYKDITFEITDRDLEFIYIIETDVISDEQETPGIDKYEEYYTKI